VRTAPLIPADRYKAVRSDNPAKTSVIEQCRYRLRDEELAELEAVRDGRRRFADLPPLVSTLP